MKRLSLVLLLAASAHAQVVATVGNNIAVAHNGRVELFDANAHRIWTAEGVEQPARIVTGGERIAVIDSFGNELRLIDRTSGKGQRVRTGETPVEALFLGRDLYVLDRDASRLERRRADSPVGRRADSLVGPLESGPYVTEPYVALAPDPAFMRAGNGMIYVYSRLDGIVQEIAPATMRIARTVTLAPFASDFEIDGSTGYLVYPADAKLRTFTLATMKRGNDIAAGAVPVDLAVTSRSNAISASRLALADPSAKRVWIIEGTQSVARAVARGFIRGLLGLGLFSANSSDFPSGVDRVVSRGSTTIAYDSTTQTLYRLKGSKGQMIARDVAPGAYALTDSGVAIWQNGALRLIR